MSLQVKLEAFEGPLDLLLHLIDKNKVSIYDIPIVTITEQYMEYINAMDRKDLDVMSEFLVMAATLLKIKSQMLLPQVVNEEGEVVDPRKELVERLLEYKMYKYISEKLKDKQVDALKLCFKDSSLPDEIADFKEDIDVGEILSDLTLNKLHTIFKGLVKKKADSIDPVRSKFGKIEQEETNLYERIDALQRYGLEHKTFSFKAFMATNHSKMDMIVSFLGILELIRMGHIIIKQQEIFDDIEITFLIDKIIPIEEFKLD